MTQLDSLLAPPEPPAEPQRLVSVRWPLETASVLVLMMLAVSVAGGLVALATRNLGLNQSAQALVMATVLIGSYVFEIGVVAWAARRLGSALPAAVGLRDIVEPGKWIAAALAVAVLARVGAAWYALILQALHVQLPGENVDVTRLFPHGPLGSALTFALLVFAAPFAEEVVFRGVLLTSLRDRWGDASAIVGSAAIFAVIHLNPYVMTPIFLLALGLGWLFVRSRSLWVNILCHASFNALGFAALMLVRSNWMLAR